MTYTISSLQNATVKHLVKLRQRRARDTQHYFLIDGARPLAMALYARWPVDTLYVSTTATLQYDSLLVQAATQGTALQVVTDAVFQKIGYGDHPDGLLGLAPQPSLSLQHLRRAAAPLYLLTEGLGKPGNLGAILRTADAAGVTGVIICDNQLDVWNPNVIRASQGTCFTVPMAITTAAKAYRWLESQTIPLLAASPAASQSYTQADMRRPTAIVVGAEHAGLSPIWRHSAGIRIPMAGHADSLNVAQAAAILLFEAVRQRQTSALTTRPESRTC